jgi:dolichol-phosphate mannosyltransferase
MQRWLVIPAYNEERALPRLLGRVAALGVVDGVLVVDDGSSDGTVACVEAWHDGPRAQVVRHGTNRGLGAAMRTALSAITAGPLADDDMVVTMDADDTHDPALIPRMCAAAVEADVVVASRYCPGGREFGLAWHRKVLSRAASAFLGLMRPVPGVRDYSCGFRAYRVRILREAVARYGADGLVTTDGFACMAEILLRLHRLGARCVEVPLELHYERKEGRSKMRIARTIRGYAQILRAVSPAEDILARQR